MFGTLRYNASSNETQFVERFFGENEQGENVKAHFACDSCRAKKLRCDGQKYGCFRCKASSDICLYTKYRSKKEVQRRPGARRWTRSQRRTFNQTETSSTQHKVFGHVPRPDLCSANREETLDTVDDNQTPLYEEIPKGTIWNPITIQGLRVEDGTLLLDRFLPDLMSNDNPQDHDTSSFDFSYSNVIETMDETVSNSIQNQLPSLDLTCPSPHLDSVISSVSSVSVSIPQWPFGNDSISTYPMSASDKDLARPTSDSESSTHTNVRVLCHCPQALCPFLEKFQSKLSRSSIQTTHFTLTHIKFALQRCAQMLDCTRCSTRSDHMMLAAVVINRLVSTMEDVVRMYNQRRVSSSSATNLERPLQSDASPRHHHHEDENFYRGLFIGDYAITSEAEWAAVTKALTVVLAKHALSLLERMEGVAKAKGRETQLQILWGAEQRIRKLLASMRDEAAPGGEG